MINFLWRFSAVSIVTAWFGATASLSAQTTTVCRLRAAQTAASHIKGPLSARTIARIDTAVSSEMRDDRIPGLSIAIVIDNRLAFERGYGFADLEACVPATTETVYRLASVSKTLTATAVMQLAESGRLDLDAPIQRYVPQFPLKDAPITSRQLLSHMSGIRHYRGEEELSVREYPSLSAALEIFARDSLLNSPGAAFAYSTYGYTLLGAAIEAASGLPFVSYLRQAVLAPAKITTIRDDSVAALIPHRARGYSLDSSGAIRNAAFLNSSYKTPGGGLVSTAGDLARFAAALQSGQLVRPSTFAQMATRARTTNGQEVTYGYGLILGEIPGLIPGAVWHAGVQQGFTSMLYMIPADGIAVVVLTNMEGIPSHLEIFTNDLAKVVSITPHTSR